MSERRNYEILLDLKKPNEILKIMETKVKENTCSNLTIYGEMIEYKGKKMFIIYSNKEYIDLLKESKIMKRVNFQTFICKKENGKIKKHIQISPIAVLEANEAISKETDYNAEVHRKNKRICIR